MQDFAKLYKNEINDRTEEVKKEKWLSKDRAWNFFFWFGISGSIAIAHFNSSIIIALLSLIILYWVI